MFRSKLLGIGPEEIKKWAKISDVNKYLRVIVLEDGETVHNAFFDRTFREKNNEG